MLKLIILTALLSLAASHNPGFRTAVTAKGLNYIDQVGLPILEQSLSTVTIPDVSGSASVPVVGSIDYDLTNIDLANLNIASSAIKSGTSGLSVQASDISLNGNANWHYREHSWPHISDSGSVDISISSVSLAVSVIIGNDTQGHATLKTTGCSLNIGNLDVKFHGGASWLYNLFDSNIESSIKSSLQEQVCTAASQSINDEGNKALESLPVIVKVDDTAEVNYALLTNPIFTTNYIETQHKGEFFSIAHPVEAPFSAPPLPAIASYDKMMYLWLTDYIANTAGVVYQQAGILQVTVTPDMVPSGLPFQLNTASFKLILPNLYKKFPNMDMELFLNATKPPVLQVVPNSADFTINGTLTVNVINSNKKKVNAFVIGLIIYTDVRIWVRPNGTQQVVSGNCTLLKFDMSLISTNIGIFSVSLLQTGVNLVVNGFVIPILNRYAEAGLVIPIVNGLSFVSPQVKLGQGYIMISTDINYKPTMRRG